MTFLLLVVQYQKCATQLVMPTALPPGSQKN